MNVLSGAAAIAAGCGLLWLSLVAKLADRESARIVWPVTGRFGRILGPGPVSAGEALVVAVLLAPLPVAVRLLPLAACFCAYAAAATVLHRRRCACFGGWLPTRFSALHVVGCACIAALAFTGVPGGLSVRAATVVAASSVTAASAAAVVLWRRAAARARQPVHDVDHFVVFTAESCPYCAALEAQRSRYAALTDKPLEFRQAVTDEEAEQAGRAFPAVVGYDGDGVPVTEPVHGLSPIRDMLRRSAAGRAMTGSAR
ncbi:hypothetical protein AB0A70_16710 [Streptomyces morookaense]|uniref:hypothetical protein n=1 Tax=Streptomyces morookaense TaxID=1970 RepID=UPI00340EACF6